MASSRARTPWRRAVARSPRNPNTLASASSASRPAVGSPDRRGDVQGPPRLPFAGVEVAALPQRVRVVAEQPRHQRQRRGVHRFRAEHARDAQRLLQQHDEVGPSTQDAQLGDGHGEPQQLVQRPVDTQPGVGPPQVGKVERRTAAMRRVRRGHGGRRRPPRRARPPRSRAGPAGAGGRIARRAVTGRRPAASPASRTSAGRRLAARRVSGPPGPAGPRRRRRRPRPPRTRRGRRTPTAARTAPAARSSSRP